MHTHHNHCAHSKMNYCAHCDQAYCDNCGKSWVRSIYPYDWTNAVGGKPSYIYSNQTGEKGINGTVTAHNHAGTK